MTRSLNILMRGESMKELYDHYLLTLNVAGHADNALNVEVEDLKLVVRSTGAAATESAVDAALAGAGGGSGDKSALRTFYLSKPISSDLVSSSQHGPTLLIKIQKRFW